jgi:imidazole glycerol-phosphate synthase subunit HisF
MLRPRVIPCLLLKGGGLVKTVRFANPKYVGDPVNAVKIFNEKEADELIVLDIGATTTGREPNYRLISQIAVECRMPFCYGGGVKTVEQAKRIVGLGVEKVALSSALVAEPGLATLLAQEIGAQSVVAVLDVRLRNGEYEVWTHNATRSRRRRVESVASELEAAGVGEIVVNSIDRDGAMNGYDLSLAARVRGATRIPLTILGGAGSLADIQELIETCGVVGAAAGSLFVFKGAYRAVLINYPNPVRKEEIIGVGLGSLDESGQPANRVAASTTLAAVIPSPS